MIQAFKDKKDIYSIIASIAFGVPYEDCLEFKPTGNLDADGNPEVVYNPTGKAKRSEAKSIVLGITYGRSVATIADQLYSHEDISSEEKVKKAQRVFDSVLNAFPALRKLMVNAQECAKHRGYVETILGRRRHIPDMQLPEFEFKPLPGYVNPDIDPLDINTLGGTDDIPDRIQKALYRELTSYKWFGQVAKRTRELADYEHIKVISNQKKIQDATRKCVNCVDTDTEILTSDGWKSYDSVSIGDTVLSYSIDRERVEWDTVNAVHIYDGGHNVVEFTSQSFGAVSTTDHRWVCQKPSGSSRFMTTDHLSRLAYSDYPILRVGDNAFTDCGESDDFMKLVGWVLTDGSMSPPGQPYRMHIYQSVKRHRGEVVYNDMIQTITRLGIEYTDCVKSTAPDYHYVYLKKCDITNRIRDMFPHRVLTATFISSLSQHQALILMDSMLQGNGRRQGNQQSIICGTKERADMFQYLCFIAGIATNQHKIMATDAPHYDNVSNPDGCVISKQDYYKVSILRNRRAQISAKHCVTRTVDTVWCVSTNNRSWVARRNGRVFITGNSIIQGSAAEQTKLAMLMIDKDPEWNALGGRVILPVHDELIAEAPIENWEACANRLSQLMCDAASFLPFASKCDVTVSYRWNGAEYPCPYPQPQSMDNLTPEEISWVQYHLYEIGYELPVFKDESGDKPKGNAALGINGVESEQYHNFIVDYCRHYNITMDRFIDHIHTKVHTGYEPIT